MRGAICDSWGEKNREARRASGEGPPLSKKRRMGGEKFERTPAGERRVNAKGKKKNVEETSRGKVMVRGEKRP